MLLVRLLAVFALCATAAFTPTAASADELVVDNSSPNVQVVGPWSPATVTSGFNGGDYLTRPASAGDATVYWPFPASGTPGMYEVFARWTSGPNRASNALYWISSDSGTDSTTRSQRADGASWQSLGSFSFTPGKQEGVTLSDRADGVVIADAVRWVGPSGAPAPAAAAAPATRDPQAPDPASQAQTPPAQTQPAQAQQQPQTQQTDPGAGPWTVALDSTELHAGPDRGTDVLARVPQYSYLQILGYQGDWAYVFNPRAGGTAFAPSNMLGPSDPPPAWVTAGPPKPTASVEQMGRAVGSAAINFYPVADKFANVGHVFHNQSILVHDKFTAADGSTWYRIDQGYLPASAVRLPRPPPRTYAGRWIDADLTEPAMLTAYNGDRVVLTTLAIKGSIANQTPTGVFSINRRVADETMDSGTLYPPIDPHGPGGYHLEHVLNTQYFTDDGASIHYNYWSSNFGYSGSHGCLGVDKEDSEFLWNWATIGTTVVIHT